jgi:hypothetical protein
VSGSGSGFRVRFQTSSDSPLKGGMPDRRIWRMTPMLHMSTASPYPSFSLMISGATYLAWGVRGQGLSVRISGLEGEG